MSLLKREHGPGIADAGPGQRPDRSRRDRIDADFAGTEINGEVADRRFKGRYADTTRENFLRTMAISCFSFTEAARRAAALMRKGGAMVTLTYNGGLRAMPNYNAMGVAKAALEASVRYLAVDFGASRIRVNAISAGPIRTLAGAGISDARFMFAFQQRHSPLHRGVTLEELGGAGVYLLSDLSTGVTGEIHFVDSGYNIIAMPHPDALKAEVAKTDAAQE